MRKRLREKEVASSLHGYHQRVTHNDDRTAAFVRTLESLAGPSQEASYAILQHGIAYMARPNITLHDVEARQIISYLRHNVRELTDSPHDQHKCEDFFRRVLQRFVPLATPDQFNTARSRFVTIEAAVENFIAGKSMYDMPPARRLECQEQRCCVWDVVWSCDGGADALLEALRVTTCGTVLDRFKDYTRAHAFDLLDGIHLCQGSIYWMFSVAGEHDFEVVDRFSGAGKRSAPYPRGGPTAENEADDIVALPVLSSSCRGDGVGTYRSAYIFDPSWRDPGYIPEGTIVLVGGPLGSGKTLAALWIGTHEQSHSTEKICANDDIRFCVFYCKAVDFSVLEGSNADTTTTKEDEEQNHNPRHHFSLNKSCLRKNSRRLLEYLVAAILPSTSNASPSYVPYTGSRHPIAGHPVRSYNCSLSIVVDDCSAYPSLITDLVADTETLSRNLKEALAVDYVRVIAVGHGIERYYSDTGPYWATRRVTAQVFTTNIWEMCSWGEKHEEEVPFLRILRTADNVTHTDPYNLCWIRAALKTNPRFASILSNMLRRQGKRAFYATRQCRLSKAGDASAAVLLRSFAHVAMLHFLDFAPTGFSFNKPNAAVVLLRLAIGAMFDRQPMNESGANGGGCDSSTQSRTDIVFDISEMGPLFGTVAFEVEGRDAAGPRKPETPLFVVDRFFCSMFMFLSGGIAENNMTCCALKRAVFDFAFLAASVPSAALEGRPHVQPLRRLLIHLGNEASVFAGMHTLRLMDPLPDNDGPIDPVVDTSSALVNERNGAGEEYEEAICLPCKGGGVDYLRGTWSQPRLWKILRAGVRGNGRAAVIANDTKGRNKDPCGPAVIVVAPRLVTLLHTLVVCPTEVLDAPAVRTALLAMAPVAAHPDCVVGVGSGRFANKKKSCTKQRVEQWQKQRVPEELAALALGVTFKRCPRTHRAMVIRRQPSSSEATAANPPLDFVVNVAVVFDGKKSSDLREHILYNAFGHAWSDLATQERNGANSGPFPVVDAAPPAPQATVAAIAPESEASAQPCANIRDRARVEVVLDYVLDEDEPPVAGTCGRRQKGSAPKRSRDTQPPHSSSVAAGDGLTTLRVAYRYFTIDVTDSGGLYPVPGF